MTGSTQINTETLRHRRFVIAISVLWTALILISFSANAYQERDKAIKAAKIENRSTFNKDIAYRRWAAEHGGVYVPASEKTPPNPYLSNLPERDILTPSGRHLTLVNPAYMTRQVHDIGSEKHGVQGHITSLNPMRPGNAADPWETQALQSIEQNNVPEVSMITEMDGESYMRLMQPLFTEESCLKCHTGYQPGQLVGGISVSTPMKPHLQLAKASIEMLAIVHMAFWLTGLGGIAFADRRFIEQRRRRKAMEKEREQLLKTLEYKNKELENVIRASTHDLKSPIVNIMGFCSELRESCTHLKDRLAPPRR